MNWIRSIVIGVLAVTALAIILFGPRSNWEPPKDRVVVDYWEKWTGEEAEQMLAIVNEFNDTVGKEKGIYVRYVSTSAITQKTLVATAAGVPPDIAGIWNAQLVQFASLDALEPLDELAAAHGIKEGYYKPVYWDGCTWNGHLYALVSSPATVAMLYNKRLIRECEPALRAAGLDPNKLPETIEELDKFATAMNKIDERGKVDRSGFLPMVPGWYMAQVYLWFGGDIWDPKTERFTLTDPNVVRAYEWVQSYTKRLGRDAVSNFRSGLTTNIDSPQNPFIAGKVVMQQYGPWLGKTITTVKPVMSSLKWSKEVELTKPLAERYDNYEWGACAFPSGVPGVKNITYAPFDAMVIPKGSKHKKEAFEFIAFVNRQDKVEQLAKQKSTNSQLANVSANFLSTHPVANIAVFEELSASPNAHALPKIPIYPEVYDELDTVIQSAASLSQEPRVALAEAQERLQKKYDTFKARQQARRQQAGN